MSNQFPNGETGALFFQIAHTAIENHLDVNDINVCHQLLSENMPGYSQLYRVQRTRNIEFLREAYAKLTHQ